MRSVVGKGEEQSRMISVLVTEIGSVQVSSREWVGGERGETKKRNASALAEIRSHLIKA